MQDCSCGVAHDDNSDTCPVSLSQPMIQEALPDLSSKSENKNKSKPKNDRAPEPGQDAVGSSRLIEFPGTGRAKHRFAYTDFPCESPLAKASISDGT